MSRGLWARVQGAPDGELPSELKAEIDAAFAEALPSLLSFCARYGPEDADDVAQEAMLVGYQAIRQFRGTSSLATWLRGIAKWRNVARRRRMAEICVAEHVLDVEDAEARALVTLMRREQLAIFTAAIQDLEAPEQEALRLRYVDELSQEEVGARLGERGHTALTRARRHLKERLRAALVANVLTSHFFDTPTP